MIADTVPLPDPKGLFMKIYRVIALSLSLTLGGAGFASAQNQSMPMADPNAPQNSAVKSPNETGPAPLRAGHNSFTRRQARARIEKAGYANITGLSKGSDGLWQAQASKNGQNVNVALDFKGNVSER